MALFMDQGLAQRLERAEGAVGAGFVEVRRRIAPQLGAEWRDFGGTYAMFDGAGSPMTQTFGLGMFGPATPEQLDEIERFFGERGAATDHEVSPLAGVETFARLVDRGYQPLELSTVLARLLDGPLDVRPAAGLHARACGEDERERERWVAASVAGWAELPELAGEMEAIARAASQNPLMVNFLVEDAGEVIATGALAIYEGVALLAGASTIPAKRGLGAQGLLLAARLDEARRRGCELAMMVAAPGSTSQRNAERRGFHIAYTRTKWRLPRRAG
ncbi:MAG TPA: GNAT family N-acetyltransferase [Kofleriaceae bacterium]|nr:GNAT family N-acetyltransferase [Kofleriaceae bacterium]